MADVDDRLLHAKVLKDLRARITSGSLPVGEPIPSTAKLVQQYEVSITVVRRAVETLKSEGVLEGQPGKGVYVIATPAEVADQQRSLDSIADEVKDLRAQLSQLADRLDVDPRVEQLATEVAALRSTVEQLYSRLGYAYPTTPVGTSTPRHLNTGT
ncbi:FadR/GntR family transcriptional regulator [Nonomuraea sp. NPDC049646]|uniref:FadR/GntR family transcriptional regulator n=1 Tax=unclassified Nonomuraea TaxID=2593643 RepID=UPI0037AA4ABA